MTAALALPEPSLWERSSAVDAHPGVAGWLAHHGADPELVAFHDLARVPPAGSWAEVCRVVVPLVDARGEVCDLAAVDDAGAARLAPGTDPAGVIGLVMACDIARRILATGAWSSDRPLTVDIVDAPLAFLARAGSVAEHHETPPATIGAITPWSAVLASRLPPGCTVALRASPEASPPILATLAPRAAAGRFRLLARSAALPTQGAAR